MQNQDRNGAGERERGEMEWGKKQSYHLLAHSPCTVRMSLPYGRVRSFSLSLIDQHFCSNVHQDEFTCFLLLNVSCVVIPEYFQFKNINSGNFSIISLHDTSASSFLFYLFLFIYFNLRTLKSCLSSLLSLQFVFLTCHSYTQLFVLNPQTLLSGRVSPVHLHIWPTY